MIGCVVVDDVPMWTNNGHGVDLFVVSEAFVTMERVLISLLLVLL